MEQLFDFLKNGLTAADWLVIGVALLLLLLLLCKAAGHRQFRKLPARDTVVGYALLYADQKREGKGTEDFGKLLYSERYDLQGKPDYIFRSRFLGRLVPVELKSGSIGEDELPHYGDYLQLAAYFLILEDVYKKRPAFGRLVYQDYMFEKCRKCCATAWASRIAALRTAAPASAMARFVNFQRQNEKEKTDDSC